MVTLREIVMIHDLHRQGLGISAIARQTGLDRKTVRKYLKQGLQTPRYGPRQPRPRLLDPYEGYLRERVTAYPGLSARRLWREIAELGYSGGYTTLTDFLREVRPPAQTGFERRFETPPGKQAQADFAHFKAAFEDEREKIRTIWLFAICSQGVVRINARPALSVAVSRRLESHLPDGRNWRQDLVLAMDAGFPLAARQSASNGGPRLPSPENKRERVIRFVLREHALPGD